MKKSFFEIKIHWFIDMQSIDQHGIELNGWIAWLIYNQVLGRKNKSAQIKKHKYPAFYSINVFQLILTSYFSTLNIFLHKYIYIYIFRKHDDMGLEVSRWHNKYYITSLCFVNLFSFLSHSKTEQLWSTIKYNEWHTIFYDTIRNG